MRLIGLACGVFAGFASIVGVAHAENEDVTVACSPESKKPRVMEYGARAAHNSYSFADQDLITAAGTYSFCINDAARIRFEGAATHVDEEGRESNAAVFGLSMPLDLWQHAAITPSVYVGYEDNYSGNDQLITAAAFSFEQQFLFGDGGEYRFTLGARPEYSNRTATDDDLADVGDQFNVTGIARLSGPLGGDAWRWRATATYADIGGGSTLDGISGLGFGVGQVDGGWYRWVADLTYRTANNDYEGVLFSITFVNKRNTLP